MRKPKSVLAKLWDWVTSLAAVAVFGWIAWYGYPYWDPVSSGASDSAQGSGFNCRRALAKLATDYTCRNSNSCTMTGDELTKMKNREADIAQYCN